MKSAAAQGPPIRRVDPERRQLTLLFCDLVGSTRLSDELDPEDYSDAMHAYYDACARVIDGLGGWIADRWMGRSMRGRIYTSAIGVSLLIPAIFGVGNATSLTMAICFLVLFGIGWGFFDGNNMPILAQIVRPNLRATGYGIMNLVSISCGGFADWGFGALRDLHVPLQATFGVFAGVAAMSAVGVSTQAISTCWTRIADQFGPGYDSTADSYAAMLNQHLGGLLKLHDAVERYRMPDRFGPTKANVLRGIELVVEGQRVLGDADQRGQPPRVGEGPGRGDLLERGGRFAASFINGVHDNQRIH